MKSNLTSKDLWDWLRSMGYETLTDAHARFGVGLAALSKWLKNQRAIPAYVEIIIDQQARIEELQRQLDRTRDKAGPV